MTKTSRRDWPLAVFGDIATNVTERVDPAQTDAEVYVGLEHLDPESLKIRRWGSPAEVIGQKLAFRNGDVIFGKRRAYQRKLAVAECDGICSAHAMVLRAKPEVILPEFLPFFMQSDMFMERAIGISVGSLSPTINWKTLKTQQFPLPPIHEQKRIAEILQAAVTDVEARILAAHAALALFRHLANSACWNNSWPEKPIREIVKGTTDRFIDGDWIETKDQSPEGIRLVQLADIGKAVFLNRSDRHVSEDTFGRLKCNEVLPGDLLVARMADPIGRACIVPDLKQRMITAVDCSIVRINTEKHHPKYWLSLMMTARWQRAVESRAGGSTRLRISRKNLESIEVPIPPLEAQLDVVLRLSAASEVHRAALRSHRTSAELLECLRERLLPRDVEGADE